ncbi:hypothetical protein D3C80_448580 [compost metagenome]
MRLSIKDRRNILHTMIREGQLQLEALRKECPHADKVGRYGSNTGNWCESDNTYWIRVECNDCGSTRTIYSDDPEYKTFDGVIER